MVNYCALIKTVNQARYIYTRKLSISLKAVSVVKSQIETLEKLKKCCNKIKANQF